MSLWYLHSYSLCILWQTANWSSAYLTPVATAVSASWSSSPTTKTLFIVWPHHVSEKVIRAKTSSCWHLGGSRAMPGDCIPHWGSSSLFFRGWRTATSLCWTISGILTWSHSDRSLCPPTLPWRTTPEERFSAPASPSWKSPVVSPRFDLMRTRGGHAAAKVSPSYLWWPLVFSFRSPTTTRPRQASCPTSPLTSQASPPAFTARSRPAVTSWRPTRTAKVPCQYKGCDACMFGRGPAEGEATV